MSETLPKPWQCHEAQGAEICVRSQTRHASAPWSCRDTLGETFCFRKVTDYPDQRAASEWRCLRDADGKRACVSKSFGNAPWHCEKEMCSRRYPDYPSAAEWECYDSEDRVLCRTTNAPGKTAPEWLCSAKSGFYLCVDAEPDVPDSSVHWACKYHGVDGARECRKKPSGGSCANDNACGRGVCSEGKCLRRLAAECFQDKDCNGKRCVAALCQ